MCTFASLYLVFIQHNDFEIYPCCNLILFYFIFVFCMGTSQEIKETYKKLFTCSLIIYCFTNSLKCISTNLNVFHQLFPVVNAFLTDCSITDFSLTFKSHLKCHNLSLNVISSGSLFIATFPKVVFLATTITLNLVSFSSQNT